MLLESVFEISARRRQAIDGFISMQARPPSTHCGVVLAKLNGDSPTWVVDYCARNSPAAGVAPHLPVAIFWSTGWYTL
jgi:hypothetical protein